MGVMACCRNGCDQIMCHNYSVETGYVCYECKSELEASNPACVQDVRNFMETEKENNDYQDDDGFSLSKMFGEEV